MVSRQVRQSGLALPSRKDAANRIPAVAIPGMIRMKIRSSSCLIGATRGRVTINRKTRRCSSSGRKGEEFGNEVARIRTNCFSLSIRHVI